MDSDNQNDLDGYGGVEEQQSPGIMETARGAAGAIGGIAFDAGFRPGFGQDKDADGAGTHMDANGDGVPDSKGAAGKSGKAKDVAKGAAKEASKDGAEGGKRAAAQGALKGAESAAGGGVGKAVAGVAAKAGEQIKSSVGGKDGDSKGGGLKSTAGIFVLLFLGLALVGVVLLALPIIIIGTIDYGLCNSLGFCNTSAILEKQAEVVVSKFLSRGEVNADLAADFAAHGIEVGQVTASGDFVKTNTYIAGLGEDTEVAANGDYHIASSESGELVIQYKERIITAADFIMAVEGDPELYETYSESLNMNARYYYSNDVNDVYKDLGLSRGTFNSWQQTGNDEADQASFNEILAKMLDSGTDEVMNGTDLKDKDYHCTDIVEYYVDDELIIEYWWSNMPIIYDFSVENNGESVTDTRSNIRSDGGISHEYEIGGPETPLCTDTTYVHNRSGAEGIAESLYYETKGGDEAGAKQSAAVLLNTAISSSEPYEASKAFLALEEPIQRARIDGDGPVNEVMNVISEENEITYTDAATGQLMTETNSIINTKNFGAAVSEGEYVKEEAANFSRDRVINIAEVGDSDAVAEMVMSVQTNNDSDGLNKKMTNGETLIADGAIDNTVNSMDLGLVKTNSETFASVVGGNRIVEGGAFLSNTINQRVIGAMPSDGAAITAYNQAVQTVLARKAEAERATKSPFDVSSPNTFLGALVRKLGVMAVSGRWTFSGVAKVLADGSENNYLTTYGDCDTVTEAGVEGDIYCSAHNTVNTDNIEQGDSFWASAMSGQIDEDGNPVENSEYAEYLVLGTDREATVGLQSADVCKTYEQFVEARKNGVLRVIGSLVRLAKGLAGLYKACDDVPVEVENGQKYALTAENADVEKIALYSGYTLFSTTEAMLEGVQSPAAAFKERYYEEHPKDNSAAGVLARRSGMTVAEAEVALAYADYVTWIARYDPSDLHVFGSVPVEINRGIQLLEQHDELTTVLGVLGKMREMDDLRRRSYSFVI